MGCRSPEANGLNEYQRAFGASFWYDANGNLIADGSSVYLYDAENRLVDKHAQHRLRGAELRGHGSGDTALRSDRADV